MEYYIKIRRRWNIDYGGARPAFIGTHPKTRYKAIYLRQVPHQLGVF